MASTMLNTVRIDTWRIFPGIRSWVRVATTIVYVLEVQRVDQAGYVSIMRQ